MRKIRLDWTLYRWSNVLDDITVLEAEEADDIDDVVLVERTAGIYSIEWLPELQAA